MRKKNGKEKKNPVITFDKNSVNCQYGHFNGTIHQGNIKSNE